MNETLKTIMNRRSIRSFSEQDVSREDVQEIIKAGQYAPSAVNRQPWHFTVVRNQKLLDEMNKDCVACLLEEGKDKHLLDMIRHPKFHTTYHAPVVIVVSMTDIPTAHIDCGIAVENMALAATSLGLGSCIIGMTNALFQSDKGKKYLKLFQLPKDFKPNLLLAIGHIKTPPSRTLERRANTVNYIN